MQVRVPVRLGGVKVPFLRYDVSISDPAAMALLTMGTFGLGAYSVYSALQSPAFYRGVALISGTIATLPLKCYKNVDTDQDQDAREASSCFLDLTPTGPGGMTPFEWKRQSMFYCVTEGGVGFKHLYSGSGALNGLQPWPPNAYKIRKPDDNRVIPSADPAWKWELSGANGKKEYLTDDDFSQVLGLSLDGVHPVSPVFLFQRGIQLTQAQDIASMKTMTSGMHLAGLISPEADDISADDMKTLQKQVDSAMQGPDRAGQMVLFNKKLKVDIWTQKNTDAQFMEGRRYSREEAALMLGLPIYMLEPSKQTSWGTGIAEQDLGLAKYTFMPWTVPFEQRVSQILNPSTKFVEFDYKQLLKAAPQVEITLILQQLDAGIMSEEEARDLLGLGPKDPGDTFREPVPAGAGGKIPLEPSIPKPIEAPSDQTVPSNGQMAGKMA